MAASLIVEGEMAEFDVDPEPIYVFHVEDGYLFKHYFARTDIFSELQDYYSDEDYRFEVPEDEFPEVQDILEDYYYTPIVVDDIEEFAVVKERYTEHSDILRNSLMHWTRQGYNFFLMKDPQSVEQALEWGASPIKDTDLVLGI